MASSFARLGGRKGGRGMEEGPGGVGRAGPGHHLPPRLSGTEKLLSQSGSGQVRPWAP